MLETDLLETDLRPGRLPEDTGSIPDLRRTETRIMNVADEQTRWRSRMAV